MIYKPCKKCSIETLKTTYLINGGLCKLCKQGLLPCIHCGKHVNEPNDDGSNSDTHVMCYFDHMRAENDLGWRSYKDIDWDMIKNRIDHKLKLLFNAISKQVKHKDEVKLVLVSGINGGWSFNVQEIISHSEIISLTDIVYDDWWETDPISETFTIFEEIEDMDDDDWDKIIEKLQQLKKEVLANFENKNYGYPQTTNVKWEYYNS